MAGFNWAAEHHLLGRIRGGDLSACDECVELHRPALYRLAFRMMKNHQEAEDVVQEAFLAAFQGIERFDGRARLGTWLFRITYNTALMRLRKKAPLMVSEEAWQQFVAKKPMSPYILDFCCLPESTLLRGEALHQIDLALDALSENLRSVFWAREGEGLSTRETANSLGISESAVKVRLHRARTALRAHLAAYFQKQ